MRAGARINLRPPAGRFPALRLLVPAFLLAVARLSAADAWPDAPSGGFSGNFRDIPGITPAEIQAVEKALSGRKSFSYGAMEGADCFYRDDGSLDGYTVSLAQLLSGLFGVPFEVRIHDWMDLRGKLRAGAIDFSGDFDPDSGNTQGLLMTRSFRERSIKFVSRAAEVELFKTVPRGPVRVAFMRDSSTGALALPHLRKRHGDKLIVVLVDDRTEIAGMLRGGELDLFIADDAWAEIFAGQPDLAVDTFHPLLYKRVAVTTGNPELAPIIRTVNKFFTRPELQYIHDLHRQGRIRFLRQVFLNSLNAAERAYYDERIRGGVPVPVGASPTNYPNEFYNEKEKRWDGLAFDILAEIGEITGLTFRPMEFAKDNWPLLLKKLRDGDPDVPMLLDVGYNEIRAKDFLFIDKPYLLDHYALISASSLKNLRHDEVLFHRVGLLEDSMFSEVFRQWFPSHADTVHFTSQYEEFAALEQGRIDLLMLSQVHFSYITNFLKRTNFKINLVFEEPLYVGFGLGRGQEELRGVISKAQALIDTQSIVRRWEYSIFDYRSEDAQTRALLLTSSSVFMLLVIALLALLLLQRRREGNRLRALVAERTLELAEQVQATQAASEAKSRFLANMSHDMRTPLNAIVGLSKLALTSGAGAADPKDVKSIHNAGLTLLALVNELLDISKIEAGRYKVSPVDYETPSLIGDTIAMNIVRLADKPVAFKLTLDETLPLRLRGDDLRVRQIFNNLLSNACKYTERGEVEWSLSWTREGDSAWLVSSVRDTGVGIRPESLEKIFSGYVNQLGGEAFRKVESTGLGLSIAWNLAKLMDGELTAESEYGKGSVFSLRVRQGFIDAEPVGPELAQKLRRFQFPAAEKPDGARIAHRDLGHAAALVVDDVESNLEVAAGMLRRYGMRVDCVTGGRRAIDEVRAGRVRYDLVFLDHMMPDMDGIETLRGIRAVGGEYAGSVPVVALTANAIAGNEQRFLKSGFQAFLAKPLDMWQLDAVLSRFVRDGGAEPPPAPGERPGAERDGARAEGGGSPLSLLREAAIPGLDAEAALKRFSGDAGAYWRVLEAFARHTPGLLEKARAVRRERLPDYTIVMHGIKGGCLGVGAAPVGRLAAELEEAARNGDFAFIAAKNAECLDELERLLAGLAALLARGGKGEKPLREAPDPETLAKLKAACAAYDMDGVDAALAELEGCRYQNRQELVVWLREQALALELARMAGELARLEREG
ncbi:MAG: transporter substrate-binding domain-containing protein [Planctomycetota bacterium]|jgi:signal transduction histidine kinase/ActR/RegA family two-component response regulator|nr:transporter substrate-binding domain-containing protein [Planctomycetota bacterium]